MACISPRKNSNIQISPKYPKSDFFFCDDIFVATEYNRCHHTLARELNYSLIKFNYANCFVYTIPHCVCRSVGRLVGNAFVFLAFFEQFSRHCSCPIAHVWFCRVYGLVRSTCGSVRPMDRPTLGRNDMISTHRVVSHLPLGRSLAHSFSCSALLARSAGLIRSLTHSLPISWERGSCLWNECINFIQCRPTVP